MAGPSRDGWLADCRGRSARVEIDDGWEDRRHHRRHENRQGHGPSSGPDACEAYLIAYEAWAATVSAGYAGQAAYATVVPATGGCCRSRPGCGETVEYVEEYVPARPVVRPRRDKRIPVAPEKRVRMR